MTSVNHALTWFCTAVERGFLRLLGGGCQLLLGIRARIQGGDPDAGGIIAARLQTDHLDLWQIHRVSFDNDPELFIRPNGAAEALDRAKQQGEVRYVGFTGHKDPAIHLKMLGHGFSV